MKCLSNKNQYIIINLILFNIFFYHIRIFFFCFSLYSIFFWILITFLLSFNEIIIIFRVSNEPLPQKLGDQDVLLKMNAAPISPGKDFKAQKVNCYSNNILSFMNIIK
jgi:hypothetical protein